MTETTLTALLDDLILKSNRHGIAFLHLDAASQQDLQGDATQDRVRFIHSAAELQTPDTTKVVCWLAFADQLDTDEAVRHLGIARHAILSWRDAGGRICLISRHPRISFPDCRGSSVLSDAYVIRHDFSSVVWGPRGSLDGRYQMLRDLGAEALAFVDTLTNDLDTWDNLDESLGSPLEWEALEGVGVVRRHPGGRVVGEIGRGALQPVLEAAIAEVFEPQSDYARVVSQLFTMERLVRHAVRSEAIHKYGKGWRASLLDADLQARVLERSRPDFGPPGSIKSIRDPMEWVTLGELIDLAGSEKLSSLGVPAASWRRMADEVLPVRNRIGHMRLIRRTDAQRTSSWLAAVRRVHASAVRRTRREP